MEKLQTNDIRKARLNVIFQLTLTVNFLNHAIFT
jgi:hypothetical protein